MGAVVSYAQIGPLFFATVGTLVSSAAAWRFNLTMQSDIEFFPVACFARKNTAIQWFGSR